MVEIKFEDVKIGEVIGAGAFGQVCKAKVKETGQLVAVKVQRPDAVQTTPLDMFIFSV